MNQPDHTPIVLAHGYLGFSRLGATDYFRGFSVPFLAEGFTEIFPTTVDPQGGLRDRATQIAAQIHAKFPNRKVHVIAHSMGGLDARYLISRKGLNRPDLVRSLTTLGTPHRGTMIADIARYGIADPRFAALRAALPRLGEEILAAVPQLLMHAGEAMGMEVESNIALLESIAVGLARHDWTGVGAYLRGMFTLSDDALRELTTENCQTLFDEDEPDLQGVPSFSYAGETRLPSLFWLFIVSHLLLSIQGANDGLVVVESASLRHSAKVSTDHIGLIGWGPTSIAPSLAQIARTLRDLPESS